MNHPVKAHIKTLELLMVELCLDANRETDSVQRLHITDRITALNWVLKCYRSGLEVEEQLVANPAHR